MCFLSPSFLDVQEAERSKEAIGHPGHWGGGRSGGPGHSSVRGQQSRGNEQELLVTEARGSAESWRQAFPPLNAWLRRGPPGGDLDCGSHRGRRAQPTASKDGVDGKRRPWVGLEAFENLCLGQL